MHIRYGYRIDVICDAPTLLVTTLDIHPSRRSDITTADNVVARALGHVRTSVPTETFLDGFDNCRRRLTMPAGGIILRARGIVHHSGFAEDSNPGAKAVPPEELPVAFLPFSMPAVSARPTSSLMSLSACSEQRRMAGTRSWKSATSFTGISASIRALRIQRRAPSRSSSRKWGFRATMPIWR